MTSFDFKQESFQNIMKFSNFFSRNIEKKEMNEAKIEKKRENLGWQKSVRKKVAKEGGEVYL